MNNQMYLGMLFVSLAIISLALWGVWLCGDRKGFVIANELLSGETTPRRAKRVMFPLFLFSFLDFVSYIIRWQLSGFSGFTAATPEGAGYSVVEHRRTFHLTPGQLWLGRIQAVIFIVCLSCGLVHCATLLFTHGRY